MRPRQVLGGHLACRKLGSAGSVTKSAQPKAKRHSDVSQGSDSRCRSICPANAPAVDTLKVTIMACYQKLLLRQQLSLA